MVISQIKSQSKFHSPSIHCVPKPGSTEEMAALYAANINLLGPGMDLGI